MSTMNKRTARAVAAGIWATTLGCAIFLVYDLNRPLHWGEARGHLTTPLLSALAAGGWLALISAVLWWQRRVQVAREFELVYARVRSGLSARMSRRHQPHGRSGGS